MFRGKNQKKIESNKKRIFFIRFIEGVARSVYDNNNELDSSDHRDSSRRQIMVTRWGC